MNHRVNPSDYLLAVLAVLILGLVVWLSIRSGNVPANLPICNEHVPTNQPCYAR